MPAPQVAFVDFLDALERLNPDSGEARVRGGLEGGRESAFRAATFDRPSTWMEEEKRSHWFAEPVLYVRRLDEATVRAAVNAMAVDLGGYWLRYYRDAPLMMIGEGTNETQRMVASRDLLRASRHRAAWEA